MGSGMVEDARSEIDENLMIESRKDGGSQTGGVVIGAAEEHRTGLCGLYCHRVGQVDDPGGHGDERLGRQETQVLRKCLGLGTRPRLASVRASISPRLCGSTRSGSIKT